MRRTKNSRAERRAIAAAYATKEPIKLIAYRFGIHESTVAKIAKSLGAKGRLSVAPKGRSARALGLAAMRLGLTVQDLELLAQSRPNPPVPGGQDRYGEQRESI